MSLLKWAQQNWYNVEVLLGLIMQTKFTLCKPNLHYINQVLVAFRGCKLGLRKALRYNTFINELHT